MPDQPDQLEPESVLREIDDLEGRIGELRQAAGMPEPDLRVTLDAALVELELALSALRTLGSDHSAGAGGSAAAETERRVLRTVFQDAPVPLFVLDRDTSVRRVNRQAATLLGTSAGYVSGKQFTAFCDLATRAALRSQLAAVVRTGLRRRVPVRFLGRDQPIDAVVTLARVWIRGEPDPMVVAVAGSSGGPAADSKGPGAAARTSEAASASEANVPPPAPSRGGMPDSGKPGAASGGAGGGGQASGGPRPGGPGRRQGGAQASGAGTGTSGAQATAALRGAGGTGSAQRDDEAVATVVHRMDVLATACELLLDEPVLNETVAMRRCARLLAAELSDWAFIDIVGHDQPQGQAQSQALAQAQGGGAERRDQARPQGAGLRRQVVIGPEDEPAHEAARTLEELAPAPETLPYTVFATGQSALRPHAEDLDLLGTYPDGQPVLARIGATSVLCVPVEDGDRCIGAITLAGSGEHGPFDLVDLGVVQRLGRYLALIIRASRLYRRRAEVADTLQSSLLPKELPSIPGVALGARYMTATHGAEVGGDFYDVFRTRGGGWGLVLGDVCGKGEDAAAVTATARHCVRLASRWKTEPAEVLGLVNETLLDEDRFVTAVMAGLSMDHDRVQAVLGTAGHPPAIVVRADGLIRTASRGGVPLGLFDDFEAGLDTIDLGVGDTLFLHSDGVLDACDLSRVQFGQERLLESLAAHAADSLDDMLNAVERALLEFCDGDLRDDVSMLALRVLPPTLA
ncbi:MULTISPECIES: SpoIIE family protein phosphatase [Actinomadura]|uniref:SpoIIE family protein phosphatase n=1 Tax=Actinomadura yumaensis TaxID=111807 RepID=A0ABW2CNK1_9ACTN|nr:SpoIIE family protein phosphatase [Actinomadura sp. J1-007]